MAEEITPEERRKLQVEQEKLNKLKEEGLTYDRARLAELEKILKLEEQTLDATEKQLKASTALLEKYQAEVEAMDKFANKVRATATVRLQQIQVEKDLQNHIEAQLKHGDLSLKNSIKLKKESEFRVLALEQAVEFQDKFTLSLKEAVAESKKFGQSMGKAFKSAELGSINATGFAINMAKGMRALAQGGKLGGLDFALGSITSILGSMVNNVVNMIVGLANLEKSFMKTTGADQEFASSVTKTYNELGKYAVSMKEASEAAVTLYKNYTDFTMLAEDQRQSLQNTTAVLINLGIAGDDLSKGMQIQSKMFGLQGHGLEKANREILTLAREIGVAPAEMAAQFASAGASLAKFGDEGMQTFKELARASKLTGMEIDKLKQMTDKFDTFEGAATQAGKLNAAIGGNMVNAMDLMMTTDPVARFDMMRDAIMDTGMTFKDMSYYQRIFYADAMGLKDVSELALVMSGRTDMLAGTTQKSAAEYQKLAEQGKAVASIQEEFNAALAENAQELIGGAKGMKKFIQLVKDIPGWFAMIVRHARTMATILGILGVAFYGVKIAIWRVAAAQKAKTADDIASIAASQAKIAAQITETGTLAGNTGAQNLNTGSKRVNNLATMQTTLSAQAATIAQLEQAMATLKAGGAAGAASGPIAFLGKVTWPVAFAVLFLGASIVGIIWAITEFTKVVADAGWSAAGAVVGLIALGGAFYFLATALIALGAPTSWAGIIAFGVIAAGVTAMGYAMGAATSGIAGFTSGLSGMMNIDPNALINLQKVISEFSNITPPDGNNTFIDKILSLQNLDLTDSVKQVGLLVTAINKTTTDEAIAFSGAMDAIRQAVVTVQAAPAAPAAPANTKGRGDQQIVVKSLTIPVTLDSEQTSKLVTMGEVKLEIANYVVK